MKADAYVLDKVNTPCFKRQGKIL